MDVENLAKELILKNMTPEQQMAVLDSVRSSVAQAKEVQKRKIGENVDLVVQALKKIESDIRSRFDDVGNAIEKRVSTIKDGRDGINGKDGRDGKDGRNGRDGAKGDKGERGQDGVNGSNGVDGVSVTSARIDFDGSLIISLSSGVELNVGEVVAPDLAESIKVITNGGGTSQYVLDTLTSLQNQINAISGGLAYQGTWNASTNSPTLASGVGTQNYYYIVGTSGSTNLDGITDWVAGDWLIFNGTVWQKIDQTNLVVSVNGQTGAITLTTTNVSEGTNLYYTDARARTSLSGGTGISYNSSTGAITNSAPDQTVSLTASTGISTSGTYPNFTITNSAPDQTVGLTGAGTTSISGTYPNFTITSNDAFTGTVTSVTGTSPVASSGGTTPAISLSAGYGDTLNPYASKTANFVLAAPNGSAGVPTFRAIVAADVPTLNQNTTGSAATVTTTINSGVVATTQSAGDNSTKVATTAYVNAITGTGGLNGFKNRIINGAMVIDQRNAGSSVTTGVGNNYDPDRWLVYDAVGSKMTLQQVTDAPAGFIKSQKITSLAATTPASTDYYFTCQRIEGFNVLDFAWGTASAATVTLSFWVKSSLTGSFSGAFGNASFSRSYPFSYTISAANTWEQKTVTVSGDTTGTWATDNSTGLQVVFDLGSGTSRAGTANTWSSNDYRKVTGSVNLIGTNGATFYITGVQLEKGSTATSFDYRPYGTELALCQRYYYKATVLVTNSPFGMAFANSATEARGIVELPTIMRSNPTALEQSGTAANYRVRTSGSSSVNCSAVPTFVSSTQKTSFIIFTVASGLTTGQSVMFESNQTTAYLGWSAEL